MSVILRNKRKGPDDFSQKHNCSFCSSYVPQVLQLEPKNHLSRVILICRTCLDRFGRELDQYMVDHFQSDFEEASDSLGRRVEELGADNWILQKNIEGLQKRLDQGYVEFEKYRNMRFYHRLGFFFFGRSYLNWFKI